MPPKSWQDGLDKRGGRRGRGNFRGRGRGRGAGGPSWRDAFATVDRDGGPSFRGRGTDGQSDRGARGGRGGGDFRGGRGGGRGRGRGGGAGEDDDDGGRVDESFEDPSTWKARAREAGDAQDVMFGFARIEPVDGLAIARVGYLVNMLPTVMVGDDGVERSALDMYFLQQDGNTFKATVQHEPYFYLGVKPGNIKVWELVVVAVIVVVVAVVLNVVVCVSGSQRISCQAI